MNFCYKIDNDFLNYLLLVFSKNNIQNLRNWIFYVFGCFRVFQCTSIWVDKQINQII